jgi:hypothetical protein
MFVSVLKYASIVGKTKLQQLWNHLKKSILDGDCKMAIVLANLHYNSNPSSYCSVVMLYQVLSMDNSKYCLLECCEPIVIFRGGTQQLLLYQ